MAETATKRTRTRLPSVRINEATEKKLDQLAALTAAKVQEAGGIAVTVTHTQLIEAMTDAALANGNGAS